MNANKFIKGLALAGSLIGSMTCAVAVQAAVDPKLPEYKVTSGVSGAINSIGSDTLANMMTLWSEDFKKSYPNVNIQVQSAGSSTAPPALTEGTSNFGPMSRAMKEAEIQAFEAKHGYKPTKVPVAIDVLASNAAATAVAAPPHPTPSPARQVRGARGCGSPNVRRVRPRAERAPTPAARPTRRQTVGARSVPSPSPNRAPARAGVAPPAPAPATERWG